MVIISKDNVYIYAKMKLNLDSLNKNIIHILEKKIEKIKHLISFHEYASDDKKTFLHIYNRAFLVSPDPYHSISEDDLEGLDMKVFFVKLYGQDSGLICIAIEENDNHERIGVITTLAVLPEKRRKGLGSALALKAYEFFVKNNIKIVECEVGEKNIASYTFIKFIGFKKYGEEVLELDL
ncbi:MAG: GNAT family N-acetyltransferase [Candidatus Helarchaeota archaeon]